MKGEGYEALRLVPSGRGWSQGAGVCQVTHLVSFEGMRTTVCELPLCARCLM